MSENSTTFHVKKGDRGLWYVTSPDHRGLLIAGDTMQDALQQVPQALDEMEAVEAAPPAWMVEVAREAVALHYEDRGSPSLAASTRAGGEDEAGPIINCVRTLRLALERGHVVVPREWTEEELLKAAREDAAQALSHAGYSISLIANTGNGLRDDSPPVQAALQARRNMLKEGAATAPAAPSVDWEAALKRAWEAGWNSTRAALCEMYYGKDATNALYEGMKGDDVAAILASLPTREA